ncbi:MULTISPECIES: MaoC family dehydratase [Chromobacterium]|uniref:MaoC family dehydratase n=1 Tax=Chromobacterium TaxID=535 RepID=UPI000D3153EC|nr:MULTISPECIES: MaoC family dehydratase [Chromobacterium]MCP1289108.1 MaoC family dehydratase [Chromobacterium sp. S0633]PTU66578.1 (R)-hydratase [Chromobacterium sp. Panama]UJB33646.1 MaoC family dehydratase [Chromobacterium sp. Beijing]
MTVWFEDLGLGDFAEFSKTITEADVLMFAAVSGDNNPVHINQEYAEQTPFETRIAHGMLTASLISTVVGTQLPGHGTIYLSQSTRFKAPVRIGDTVTARATVIELNPDKHFVKLATQCSVRGKVVLEGESLVKAPSKP